MRHLTGEHGVVATISGTGGRIGATTEAGQIAKVNCIPAQWGDAEANARLISAAPDSHKANLLFVQWLDSATNGMPSEELLDRAAKAARAAIKSATA